MKVIRHYAPSQQFQTRKHGDPMRHFKEIITLVIFKEIDLVRNATSKMMYRVRLRRAMI
jgi:hypothetical protein